MTSLISRFKSLINLVKSKQKAGKNKVKLLQYIIASSAQMKQMKKVDFKFQTIGQLYKQLLLLNVRQLLVILLLALIILLMRLFTANFNSLLISYFQEDKTVSNLLFSVIFVVFYKITKCLIDQISIYQQMNYGNQGYSALYYHFLSTKKQMTGEILNIIEDDMQKIANLLYSLLGFPFETTLIITLTTMLVSSVPAQSSFFIILIPTILYGTNCASGVFNFKMNQKIMKQKDFRLSLNLKQESNPQQIEEARKKQVSLIKIYLLVKVAVKWFTELCFFLLYGIVFLWQTSQQTASDDQLYYRLMLLGMLKVPFSSLFMQSYYIALSLNSLKRIIKCQNAQLIEKSTIGNFQDFLKKNSKMAYRSQLIRQSSTQSSNSQTLLSQSVISADLRFSSSSTNLNIEIKEMKQSKIVQQGQNNNKINKKFKKSKYVEKGEIKIFQLLKYIQININFLLILGLIIFGIGTFFSKFYNLQISNAIIQNELSIFQQFVFILPTFLYTLLYLTVVFLFVQVSHNLFKNLSSAQIQGQDLNRVSGDIQMVDKYIASSFYEFFVAVFGILASLTVSVSLIDQPFLILLTSFLLLVIIYLSIYFNRYFMKSRRQIKRSECKMKSQIIQLYTEQITAYNGQQVDFIKVNKNWKRINLCKNVGVAIENTYVFLLNMLVLLIQIICLVICRIADLDNLNTKLILVFILQIDLTLTGLFLNTINLEMGLVNFQRCLNFVKRQNSQQDTTKNQI